jgi:mannan endo-1,4-beta-mannosidase
MAARASPFRRAWAALLAGAIGAAPLCGVAAPQRGFVRVAGTEFVDGDRPFVFVGANLNVMHEPTARRQAATTIAAAAADGLLVGRIWALGEGTADAPSWQRDASLFRSGPEGWHEEAFIQLDRVIAEAGRRGLRLIITLSNSWGDYGGIPMYLRWAGHVDVESYGYSDRFFTDPKCRAWYVEHVRRVVGRTNTITGQPYRDDPTIMAWELQNEMNGTPEAAPARERWVGEMSRLVRRLDANHLVVPGIIGYNLQLERGAWIRMCQLPEVSFCDQHIYPEEHLRTRGLAGLRRAIDDRVQLAHNVVRKPIVFGEFGFDDKGPPGARVSWHQRFLERVLYDGGNGALVWIYQPTLPWKRTYPILVDKPRHLPLRRALGAIARRAAAGGVRNRNAAINPAAGDRPLAPTHALMTRAARPHGRWTPDPSGARGAVLAIPVDRFSRAWFEEAGSWDGGILVHAYGRRTGWFEYRFAGPTFIPSRLEIRARLSSEYPGATAPPHGTSRVKILLDGGQLTVVRAKPDDGVGAWTTISVTDAGALERLRGGVHVLRFQVDAGPESNGLAIYGVETKLNREPVDDPAPLQITAWR